MMQRGAPQSQPLAATLAGSDADAYGNGGGCRSLVMPQGVRRLRLGGAAVE
jgi:hypothetical protein